MDLGDIPMHLLDDIAPQPMHTQPAAASAAASGRSSGTAALTTSASRGSGDLGVLGAALGSTSSTPWHPAAAQQAAQQAWHAAARQPPTLPSGSSVAPAVLASARSMLSMPGMVAAGQAAPLVGYGMQPSGEARKLTSLSLKVRSPRGHRPVQFTWLAALRYAWLLGGWLRGQLLRRRTRIGPPPARPCLPR